MVACPACATAHSHNLEHMPDSEERLRIRATGGHRARLMLWCRWTVQRVARGTLGQFETQLTWKEGTLRRISFSKSMALVASLVALNAVAYVLPTNSAAQGPPPVGDECTDGSGCPNNKCSGECVNGVRTNCFCCSGLCWVCGDDC